MDNIKQRGKKKEKRLKKRKLPKFLFLAKENRMFLFHTFFQTEKNPKL